MAGFSAGKKISIKTYDASYSGLIDGINRSFELEFIPVALQVFKQGLLMKENIDYTYSDNVVLFVEEQTPSVGTNLIFNLL